MKINQSAPWKQISWLGLGAAILLVVQPAFCRSAAAQTAEDLQQSNQDLSDFANGSEDAGGASLLNLINQLQLLNGRSSGEFAQDQDESFNSAIQEFHNKQRLQLESQTPRPVTPAQPTSVQ